jgi:RND superfamily putative drug exporter
VLDLLGKRTWALPGRLDRLLPRLSIEGATTRLTPAEEADFAAFSGAQQHVQVGRGTGG